jgi:peptidoglycan/xylan/chitin deacetylase (PgdA/CDA1 family)
VFHPTLCIRYLTNKFQGNTTSHCKTPDCQVNFGLCDNHITPAGPSTANDLRPTIGSVPYNMTIYHCSKEKVVGLTYDDGPSDYTEALLDLLQNYGFHATFFVVGNNNGKGPIDQNADMINSITRMDQEGHQIANHGWSHYNYNQFDSPFRLDDMVKNERAIANIIGKYPTYMRPPYNACSKETGCWDDIEKLGYHRISQDLNTEDWAHATPDQIQKSKDIVKAALERLGEDGNALSIQHDIMEQSVMNLSAYLFEEIVDKGWKGSSPVLSANT